MLLTGTGMDLETVNVSEVSQKEKDKYIISLMWNLQIVQMNLFAKQK